jgi:hypothetical protein
MQFIKFASAAAMLASSVAATSVEFVSQDNTNRTVYFTCNPGHAEIPTAVLAPGATITVPFPDGWQGNFHTIAEGEDNVPGMLGEVCMNCWNGISYFDVSAIVTRVGNTDAVADLHGIKQMFPKSSGQPISGCESYDTFCDAAYYNWDDVQTKSTSEQIIVTTVGTPSSEAARSVKAVRAHPRHFLEHVKN